MTTDRRSDSVTSRDPVVRLTGVSKKYVSGAGHVVRAVDNANLHISAGELISLIGRSGSGKTTLLHLIGTLDSPSSGEITVLGQDITDATDDELAALRSWSIGFVFQSFCLIDTLSALENVAAGLLYRGVAQTHREQAARAALFRVGLESRSAHRPAELSGGERQRVAIARAIIGERTLIIADEPTGNLDSKTAAEVWTTLRNIADEGCAVIAATHDTESAALSHRQIRIEDGSLV